MHDDTYTGGPSADTYGIETPSPKRPAREFRSDDEANYDGPAYERSPRERYRPPRYVRWIGGILIVCVALLLVCGGGAAVLVAIAFNSTPATATVDKTLTVSGAPTLIIHGAAGSVHVTPGSGNQITLHANERVRALTHSQAQSELNAITITTTQTGNTVNIQENDASSGHLFPFAFSTVDLNVTTPAATSLNVVLDAGSLGASGLTGKLTAKVDAGSMTLDGMTLASGSSLRVDAGSLSLNGALQSGASLLVVVNAGSVDLTLPR
ncbi:MAG: hypothetical protein ACRDHP_15505, partial [Ktedonobacterales bacterium]